MCMLCGIITMHPEPSAYPLNPKAALCQHPTWGALGSASFDTASRPQMAEIRLTFLRDRAKPLLNNSLQSPLIKGQGVALYGEC